MQDVESAMAGETDAVIEGGIVPMLAKTYEDRKGKVSWPMFAQPKLDGHRCIAVVKNGECTLWSRTRKPILSMPHIVRAVERLASDTDESNFVLDGELYVKGIPFEELTSLIRPSKPCFGHENVEYHVYDLPRSSVFDVPQPFAKRIECLNDLWLAGCSIPRLYFVKTTPVEDEEEMKALLHSYLDEGYEGLMLRDGSAPYENKRSNGLLKVKLQQDAEFLVVGVEEGRGKLTGHAIFVCETAGKATFTVKLKGATAALKSYWEKPETAVGRMLTVQYFEMTAEGLPRFPVGLRFREDV